MMASTDLARQSGSPATQARGRRTAYATYTVTDAPQTPARPQGQPRPARQQYSPPPMGQPKPTSGNAISVLEAEYLATMFLIFLTVFTDQTSTYGSKMLAVMKRMTFASILFFILGLVSTGSENTAKFSKAVGALVLAGVFLGTAGQGTISALDNFFKADWTQGSTTEGDSSSNAPAGTQATAGSTSSSKLQTAENAFLNALNKVGHGGETGSTNPLVNAFQRLLGAI
jgi:hypothetical protein